MMSRRTFGRIDKKNSNNNNDDNLPNIIQEKTHIISTRVATPPSRSDSTESSQSEEDTARDQEKSKHVVEWTEYDEKNLMNLGSSEIERNKRLESLIAKRRARKMFSMQPRRHNFYSFDQHDHLDQQVMGSIIVSKGDIEFDYNGDDYHQPGSAPSVLLPTRNPFDLPYDPHEEKPVLTGAFPRNNNNLLQQSNLQDILACNTNSPSNIIPSKMQERSFYTEPHHHKSNFSIASDMQVEVSEGGSPPMTANEANSPTDQDSYDGDDNKDVSSIDDEDLWGISPHPTKRGEFGMNFKLKDTLEEEEKVYNRPSNLCDVVNNVHNNENDDPSPTISMSREEEEGGSDQEARIGGVVFSLSTRSILPNEGKKKLVVDLQSTNGDILESSSSSSSEGLTSQMLGKVDHLAEYLANLPPSECGSNFLEDVERSSHVRERKTEETFHDEINQIFEFDENKEDSKEGSHRSVEDSTSTTSQIEVPKERSATSNEFHANDLINKEHVDQNSSTTEQNDYFRRIEDEGEPLEENENEVNSRPELKESISDSNSTTCQEDLLDQLRLEDNMKVTPLHQVQDHEHKDESSLSNQIIHDADESTSQEKANKDRYGIDSNSTK
uniref:Uncharacterized protein n=1 Tax=Chenopodium quinoa TaxID=63459 RepID=A0A803LX95_CHEQI